MNRRVVHTKEITEVVIYLLKKMIDGKNKTINLAKIQIRNIVKIRIIKPLIKKWISRGLIVNIGIPRCKANQ